MFCIKVSIKDKRTKPKENIPLSLFLSVIKHKFLKTVMFLTKELYLSSYIIPCSDVAAVLLKLSCL